MFRSHTYKNHDISRTETLNLSTIINKIKENMKVINYQRLNKCSNDMNCERILNYKYVNLATNTYIHCIQK